MEKEPVPVYDGAMRTWFLVAALSLVGCKEKAKDAVAKYQPRFEEKWNLVAAAAQGMPPPDAPPIEGAPLDPPVLATDDLRGNTDIVDGDKLTRPMTIVNLGFASALQRGYDWGNGRCPPDFPCPVAGDDASKPAESIVPDLEAMLARRYVAVYRVVDNKAPAPQAPGHIDLQAVLVDLSTGKPVRSVRVLAAEPAGGDWDRLVGSAHDGLIDALSARAGGRWELKRARPKPARPAVDALLDDLPAPVADAPQALVDAHAGPATLAARDVQLAGELMGKGVDPANVCRSARLMARMNRFDGALQADIDRVCVRDAGAFWAEALAGRGDCEGARAQLARAAGSPRHAAAAAKVAGACPK